MPRHLPTTPAPSQSATHFWYRKQGSQLFEWNHAASVKSKQLHLLFQSFYAFGQRISVLLTKMKFQLYGGVDYVTFCISFILALFFKLSLVGSILLPFGTWHSSIWKSVYSGKETNSNKTAGILETLFIIWSCTVNILCSSENLLHSYPGVAALGNAFIYLFMSTSLHLFYFSPFFLSPLSFLPSPLRFPSFLPVFHILSVLFHLDLKAQKK